jgi:cleavage and polyadenylation specificity factor subunit 1
MSFYPRTVPNDMISRPLSTGILDGSLLAVFAALEVERQMEITKQIGTDRLTIVRDLMQLHSSW